MVAATAGARNTSAAAYHFGSCDRLLDALFETRMEPINARRLAILAGAGGADSMDLPALVRALVEPLVESLDERAGSTHYGRFLAVYLRSPDAESRFTALDRPVLAGLHQVTAGMFRHLGALPHAVRNHRVELAARMVVDAVADFERDRDAGRADLASTALLASMVTDSIVGMLEATSSARTTELTEEWNQERSR